MNTSLELNDASFEEVLKKEPVVLIDFYASWCGNCRVTWPIFQKLAKEANTPLYKIDVEKNPLIKDMLTLEGLPTLGLFRNGEPIAAINATKEEALRTFFQENSLL